VPCRSPIPKPELFQNIPVNWPTQNSNEPVSANEIRSCFMSALQTDSEREQNDALWLMNGSQSRKPRDHEARATAEASMACQAITEAISFGGLCSRLRVKAERDYKTKGNIFGPDGILLFHSFLIRRAGESFHSDLGRSRTRPCSERVTALRL